MQKTGDIDFRSFVRCVLSKEDSMRFINSVLLCGQVSSSDSIRSFSTTRGRILCFDLMTKKHGGFEYHHVVARDGSGGDLATRSLRIVTPGREIRVSGRLSYRLRMGTGLGEVRVTEIDALSICPVMMIDENSAEDHNAQRFS